MPRLQFTLLVFLLTTLLPAAAASPMEVVRSTSEQILAELREHDNLNREQIDSLVEKKILPHLDFEAFSRLILAKYWRRATPAQREAFTREFRDFLIHTYASSLNEYSGEKINFLSERDAGDGRALVRTEIIRQGGPPVPVDYRLRRDDGKWKVYDILIDGISLIINYRSSFHRIIRQEGLDALIQRLAERRLNLSCTGEGRSC